MYQTGSTKIIDLEMESWTVSLIYIVREWNVCLKSRKHLEDVNESFIAMNALCRFSFWGLWACVYSAAPEPKENSVIPKAPVLISGMQSSLGKHTQIQYGCWVHRRLSKPDFLLPFDIFHVFNVNYYKKWMEKIKKAQECNFMRRL